MHQGIHKKNDVNGDTLLSKTVRLTLYAMN